MIELKGYSYVQTQSSAAILCFTNYNQSFCSIISFDIKLRRKQTIKQFNVSGKPTKLFQLDKDNILVGLEGGKIEHLRVDQDNAVKVIDAHPEAESAGISVITELKSKSPLLRNALPDESGDPNFRVLVTASAGSKILKLWKVDKNFNITPYFKIETSIDDGILYLVETTDTQFVAANKKSLRMFNFIDRAQKEAEEKKVKTIEEVQSTMKELFKEVNEDPQFMKTHKMGLKKYLQLLHSKLGADFKKAAEASDECIDNVWF